jgi:nucleoside-diphosphate-sugar epimerase
MTHECWLNKLNASNHVIVAGSVGSVLVRRLAKLDYKVKALVRDPERATKVFEDCNSVEIVPADLREPASLAAALQGATAVVCCTGTTAFPSAKWAGGNTPDEVNNKGVSALVAAAAQTSTLKRFVQLSSIGVERRGGMPFTILNAFGVLDSLAKAEDSVRTASLEGGFEYVQVRPGQILDDVTDDDAVSEGSVAASPGFETLLKKFTRPQKLMRAVSLQLGDAEAGDITRSAVVEVLLQSLLQDSAAGKSFTAINREGIAPSQTDWNELFAKL